MSRNVKRFKELFVTRHKNATRRNAKIESRVYPCIVFCVAMKYKGNTSLCVILIAYWALDDELY